MKAWVCMGGKIPEGREANLLMPAQLMFGNSDANARGSGLLLVALRSLAMQASIIHDGPAAAYAIEHWPKPIVCSGWEIGQEIMTGAGLRSAPAESPVRRAYELYHGLGNRQSWDQTAMPLERNAAPHASNPEHHMREMTNDGKATCQESVSRGSGSRLARPRELFD